MSEQATLPTLVRCLTDVAPRYANRYSVGMEPRGLYREQNGWAKNEHSARVKDDEHLELDVSESLYRAKGYQPPFDELPWLDEIATT
jgi:hypothetical protein